MNVTAQPRPGRSGGFAAASAAASQFNPGMYYMQPGGMAPGQWPAADAPRPQRAISPAAVSAGGRRRARSEGAGVGVRRGGNERSRVRRRRSRAPSGVHARANRREGNRGTGFIPLW